MGIISVPEDNGGIVDQSKYIPFFGEASNFHPDVINTYKQIVLVTGKGYIHGFYVYGSGIIKAVIDGVDYFVGKAASTASGIYTPTYVYPLSSAGSIGPRSSASSVTSASSASVIGLTLPTLTEVIKAFFLPQPIYFNTSFELLIKHSNLTDNIMYNYQGGVQ